MRDILLTAIIMMLLPLALWRPVIGAYLWTWVSIMNPHMLTFGFARSVPFALIIAVVTLLGFLFTKDKKPLPVNGGTIMLLLLIAWMTVTSVFALGPPDVVWDRWWFGMKIFLMFFITLALIRGRRQIDWLIWVIVISVGYYGVKGGIWTILTGGGGRVWGPPGGMIAGNNELAVALVLLMPWMYYLQRTTTKRWIQLSLLVSMIVSTFAILGTQSRGALLGLLAMVTFFSMKAGRFFRTTVVVLVVVVGAVTFMPSSWTERIDTVAKYEDDGSAMTRIYTWQTLWNAALDRPLVGTGFGADSPLVFALYAPRGSEEALQGRVFVAHSIYLQALGEHGFPGFVLYLGIGLWVWFAAGRLATKTATDHEFETWVPLLMRMCQVSLIGFAVGGAFLSLMLLDLPYYILGVVALTRATVDDRIRARLAAGANGAPQRSTLGAENHAVVGRSAT